MLASFHGGECDATECGVEKKCHISWYNANWPEAEELFSERMKKRMEKSRDLCFQVNLMPPKKIVGLGTENSDRF